MKKNPFLKLLLIILLSLSITLSGCSSNKNQVNDSGKLGEVQEINNEENSQGDTTVESSINKEIEEDIEEIEEVFIVEEEKKISEDKDETPKEIKEETKDIQVEEKVEETEIKLKIEGSVGKEMALSVDGLKALKKHVFKGEFYSINNFGTTSYTEFKGINLWSLLKEEAQISPNATQVTIIAIDGYKMEFTIEAVMRQDYLDETRPDVKLPMIIAWEENGEEYDQDEGSPFKLVIGQKEPGDVNKPQWVSKIDKIIVK